MAKVADVREIVDYIKSLGSGVTRAIMKAQLATITKAEALAKGNAQRQFVGRNDRRLSGSLMNSIYSGMENDNGKFVGFVGVRNIPYGAVHEFGTDDLPGGAIKPKNAKNLWIPQHANIRSLGGSRMTPREFIKLKQQNPRMFYLNDKVAGKWENPKAKTRRLIPLFFLTKQVKIPARPYVRPAIEAAIEFFPDYFDKFSDEEMK